RMSNLLAGVGRTQLQMLDQRVEMKRRVFRRYYHALADLPGFEFMPELENTRSNRWLTTLTIDEVKAGVTIQELLFALNEENIEARHVWKPLHMQPLFKGARYYAHKQGVHVAEQLFRTGICLPSGTNLSETDQQRVIHCIKETMRHHAKNNVFSLKKNEVLDQ